MTCVDARDQLPEYALGVLPAERVRDLERHLEGCAGCRRETAELHQGVETMSFSLPQASPPPALADRVVRGLFEGARAKPTKPRVSRRLVRALAAATIAAALLAFGSIGWGVAQRQRAQSINELAHERIQNIDQLRKIIGSIGGQPFQAQLIPVAGIESSGTAIIVSASGANSFVAVDVLPLIPNRGPYTVQLIDRSGRVFSMGHLQLGTSGDLISVEFSDQDLSRSLSVTILDNHSNVVMTGKVAPYSNG
jgi:hypothetical protein